MSDRECKNNLLASSAAVTSLGADSTSISAALADLALLSFYSIMGSEVLWSFQAKKCRPYERPLNHLAAAALALHSSTESPPISYSNIVRYWPLVACRTRKVSARSNWSGVTTKLGAIPLVWNPPQHFKGYAAGVAWKHALHAQRQVQLVETTVVVY